MDRKQKERENFVKHGNIFKKLKLSNPTFILKMAFFEKGRQGRVVQFYESELKKNEDLYIEFIDVVRDENGNEQDYVPQKDFEERPLFKLKANPYYAEEYELREKPNYSVYIVSASELMMVQEDATEISFALYEKRKEEARKKQEEEKKKNDSLPRLQKTLTVFPDFEDEYLTKKDELNLDEPVKETVVQEEGSSLANISLKDFAAIMLVKPVSDKKWLNDLITEARKDL